jgi:hypothetical protein
MKLKRSIWGKCHTLKIQFLLILLSVTIGANAQLNFKKGYVITNSNDTLYGKINDGGGNRNARVCMFKQIKGSKAVKYYPNDIKAYRFKNEKYYATKRVIIKGESRYVFVDVLIEGKINLYHYRKTKDMNYYIEKKDSNMIGLVHNLITVRPKSKSPFNRVVYWNEYDLDYSPFLDTLYYVFRDCEKILNKIEGVEYDQKSLTNITKEYLKEVYKGNDCINYESDLNMYRPTIGVFSGIRLNKISFLESNSKSNLVTSFPIGIFFNLPMPLLLDKLSFQFELISNTIEYTLESVDIKNHSTSTKINSNTIGMPLLFKYEISRGRISPFVSGGKEIAFVYHSKINESKDNRLHPTQKNGWLSEIGLTYKLAPKLSLISAIRFQSSKNLIIGYSERASYNSIRNKITNPSELKTNYTTFSFGLKF